jgi:DNA polymerase III alpha subunit
MLLISSPCMTLFAYARSQNILCQGRGSAANSTVCFCLGITSVNPEKFDLLFERFISAARNEPPDIDVDFEHERREEVMQYIFQKYGRDRAAIVATVTQQHFKGAVRDVGKAMGLSVGRSRPLCGVGVAKRRRAFRGTIDRTRLQSLRTNTCKKHCNLQENLWVFRVSWDSIPAALSLLKASSPISVLFSMPAWKTGRVSSGIKMTLTRWAL